jgi:hypothetical protein
MIYIPEINKEVDLRAVRLVPLGTDLAVEVIYKKDNLYYKENFTTEDPVKRATELMQYAEEQDRNFTIVFTLQDVRANN